MQRVKKQKDYAFVHFDMREQAESVKVALNGELMQDFILFDTESNSCSTVGVGGLNPSGGRVSYVMPWKTSRCMAVRIR